MSHPLTETWEAQLKTVLDRIDEYLEERYGSRYPLHPARTPRGRAANRQYDGLFSVTASFSAGFGSKHGRGYTFDVHLSTLSNVPEKVVDAIEAEAAEKLREWLPEAFPGRHLTVKRESHGYKILGDLGLD